jgi:hypothetical protein
MSQARGDGLAAAANADQREIADAAAALGDFHGDAAEAAPDRGGVEEGFRHEATG